jgi:DNA-binding transcriptional ArsR family regulator
MKKYLLVPMVLFALGAKAQIDSTLLKRTPVDTSRTQTMNMDAVYNRPFLQIGNLPASIGGYVEADYQYMGEDGITDGHSFRIPRFTLFVASSVHRKIKFLSEIELADVLNLAGNAVRLKILYLLTQENELCPCDLSDILSMTVPAVSQHLKKLKDAGIVTTKKSGQTIFYSVEGQSQRIISSVLDLFNLPNANPAL